MRAGLGALLNFSSETPTMVGLEPSFFQTLSMFALTGQSAPFMGDLGSMAGTEPRSSYPETSTVLPLNGPPYGSGMGTEFGVMTIQATWTEHELAFRN